MSFRIPFNKPYFTGREAEYMQDAVSRGHISGNGHYTKKCQEYFEEKYGFGKCLLTTSCTDALEMAAILLDIQDGDEVIMPSYTFVSTANAFVLRGARIIFADSRDDHPGMDESKLRDLITPKTKAIVPVHYAGVACDMDVIMDIANEHNIFVVEDAAQAIDSTYKNRALGGIGHLGTFSFHETKNISSGEGGLLIINDPAFEKRAEIIWEKGTNRAAFWRGEVDKYGWVDMGSSFLPSDLIAAVLYAQLEQLEDIQTRRIEHWERYMRNLKEAEVDLQLPGIPEYASNNGHMFYCVARNEEVRRRVLSNLKESGIYSVFHYLSLNDSPFYLKSNQKSSLPNAEHYTQCLFRLPMYYQLTSKDIDEICHVLIAAIKA